MTVEKLQYPDARITPFLYLPRPNPQIGQQIIRWVLPNLKLGLEIVRNQLMGLKVLLNQQMGREKLQALAAILRDSDDLRGYAMR